MRATSTDTEGRYEIRDLPAGRYTVTASKAAYLDWSYGQTRPNGPPKPVVLTENQTAGDIDVRIRRGSVITGHVTDEFGDPIPNVEVTPIRKEYSEGQRRLSPAGRSQTNDIGEYRIFGLRPGQYYVSARAQAQSMPTVTGNVFEMAGERNGFASTFYPATPDPASARALTLGVGQAIDGIDIALQPVRLATISGIALDSQGAPLSAGGVSAIVRGAGTSTLGLINGPVNKDGTFRLPNVPPGEYIVRVASPRLSSDGRPTGPAEFAVAFVTINGEDLSGVTLIPFPAVTVTGRLVFDDTAAAQSVKPSAIRLLAQPVGLDEALLGSGVNPTQTIRDDFAFEFKTRPGRIGVRPVVPSGPSGTSGWQLKAIRVGGVDVTDAGIDVGAEGLHDVEIEMTDRMQKISGTVTDAAGAASRDYTVALFSQNRSQWTEPMGRRFAAARPSDSGGFTIMTLPPGEYFAIALPQLDTDWQDPENLESLSRLATPFVLATGDARTLDLRLVTTR